MQRRIMHIDMDAFFASVEQLDDPGLKGKPVIVGGSSMRSVVSACSYEARKYGVRSAMPMVQAKKLCPKGCFVPLRMGRYGELSKLVMSVLDKYSPLVEQASVDEAFLDATGAERLFGPPLEMARMIKADVLQASSLTCSIGVAPLKFLAKIASDRNKPDGIFILEPEEVEEFLRQLPIRDIPGVGKSGGEKLARAGVKTAGDMLKYPQEFWLRKFGKWGGVLYDRARGIDPREVKPYRKAKSESAENTFRTDTSDPAELEKWLFSQSERVAQGLRRMKVKGATVTLKVKYADFKSITRSKSLPEPTSSTRTIFQTALELLAKVDLKPKVRLIGVGVSNFDRGQRQARLLENESAKKDEQLEKTVDQIKEKFGREAIVRGKLFDFKSRK